jgi:hypothetical protein
MAASFATTFRAITRAVTSEDAIAPLPVTQPQVSQDTHPPLQSTTPAGSFSKDATVEANRAGVPAVELIDGDRLCDLLKEYRLGVRVTSRTVQDIEVVPTFFEKYDS